MALSQAMPMALFGALVVPEPQRGGAAAGVVGTAVAAAARGQRHRRRDREHCRGRNLLETPHRLSSC